MNATKNLQLEYQKRESFYGARVEALRRRDIVRVERLAAVVVGVKARPVSSVLPALLTHLDGSSDLFEVAGNVQDSDHAENFLNLLLLAYLDNYFT